VRIRDKTFVSPLDGIILGFGMSVMNPDWTHINCVVDKSPTGLMRTMMTYVPTIHGNGFRKRKRLSKSIGKTNQTQTARVTARPSCFDLLHANSKHTYCVARQCAFTSLPTIQSNSIGRKRVVVFITKPSRTVPTIATQRVS